MMEPWQDETIGNIKDWGNNRTRNPITMMEKCNPGTKLVASIIWVFGFLCLFLFPPLGVLIITGAITMTERSK